MIPDSILSDSCSQILSKVYGNNDSNSRILTNIPSVITVIQNSCGSLDLNSDLEDLTEIPQETESLQCY